MSSKFFFDPDFRKDPKTDFFCCVCQRDLFNSVDVKYVYVEINSYCCAVHPDHLDGSEEKLPIGPSCSKRIPPEFLVDGGPVINA